MIPDIPEIIPIPFAQNGDRRSIPENNTTPGDASASWQGGFPPITRINKQAGGKPPYGVDFQGIFFSLSQHIYFQQSGNVYPWHGADGNFLGLDYLAGAHVMGSDGEEYVALKPSGPDVPASGGGFVGPVDPVGDETGTWALMSSLYAAGIANIEKVGLVKPDGVTITIKPDGTISAASKYDLCEFYYFRHPTLKPGFQPAQGGLLANAATLYPEAWAYLQTSEGQKLCTTEAEWRAMTTAIWHTNADGTTVGWNGIGGAPFYVQDLSAGTLRMPDLRGMYVEAAGFDSLGVGGVHGDAIRNIVGSVSQVHAGAAGTSMSGAIRANYGNADSGSVNQGEGRFGFVFDPSRVVPTANKMQPRAWGALACVYLGAPRQTQANAPHALS